jgi:hypothetical protein
LLKAVSLQTHVIASVEDQKGNMKILVAMVQDFTWAVHPLPDFLAKKFTWRHRQMLTKLLKTMQLSSQIYFLFSNIGSPFGSSG